jgi:hypothetical protein
MIIIQKYFIINNFFISLSNFKALQNLFFSIMGNLKCIFVEEANEVGKIH